MRLRPSRTCADNSLQKSALETAARSCLARANCTQEHFVYLCINHGSGVTTLGKSGDRKKQGKRSLRIREVPPTFPRPGAPRPPGSVDGASSRKLPDALSIGLEPRVRKALDHPSRRVILRGLHEGKGGAMRTAEELLPEDSASTRNHHTAVLRDCQVVEQVTGCTADESNRPMLRSAVVGDATIELVLEATKQWDIEGTGR